ncbi:23955_t:CDS:2 [Gigaspora margarita]|uniref:23955_t:CDS:1 n=1 Tax=Gigaspora margarita TaxID=4874 RepID=A0ABN7UWJ1_GIGMA|nr:23955_t:CDS:2 [Gigaspora margarita]
MQRQYKLQLLSYLLGPSFIFTFVCPVLEISPIPFSCPRSYPYTSPKVKEACDIRAANLIFMWLNIFCLIIVITLICYPDKPDKSVRGNGNGVSIRRRSQSAKQAESNITASSFVARLFGDQYIPKSEVKKHRQEDSEIFIDSESENFVDSQLQIA